MLGQAVAPAPQIGGLKGCWIGLRQPVRQMPTDPTDVSDVARAGLQIALVLIQCLADRKARRRGGSLLLPGPLARPILRLKK